RAVGRSGDRRGDPRGSRPTGYPGAAWPDLVQTGAWGVARVGAGLRHADTSGARTCPRVRRPPRRAEKGVAQGAVPADRARGQRGIVSPGAKPSLPRCQVTLFPFSPFLYRRSRASWALEVGRLASLPLEAPALMGAEVGPQDDVLGETPVAGAV